MLIVCEVALSLILLTGAGLLMRSFMLQRTVDVGLRPERLLTTQVFLDKKYKTADEQTRFFRAIDAARPGITRRCECLCGVGLPSFRACRHGF